MNLQFFKNSPFKCEIDKGIFQFVLLTLRLNEIWSDGNIRYFKLPTQPAYTCSKTTIKTLE